jgi:hypothetical protein
MADQGSYPPPNASPAMPTTPTEPATGTTTDAKVLNRQAEEAERRLAVATNAIATTEARRKQLETDASAAQTRF